jgi:parallel beta-helix repeat protein
MHRKILVIGIILLLLCGGVTAFNTTSVKPQLKGQTLYVGGSGPGNYSRIQDAIDNTSDGDTVFVYNDSSPYNETLILGRSINLVGQDKFSTIIRGNGNNIILKIESTNSIINGFTFLNGYDGILINSYGCRINNNIIKNNSNWGIVAGQNNIVDNNYIFNNSFGGIASISNNQISSNIIKFNEWFGVNCGSNDKIINNSFFSNGEDNTERPCDIHLNVEVNVTMKGNTFNNSKFSKNAIGIRLDYQCINNNIRNNYFINYQNSAIYIQYSNKNNIIDNYFYNNGIGIYLIESVNNKILNNTFIKNDVGINLLTCFFTQIMTNIFMNNSKNADFAFSFLNTWQSNFWNRSRTLPYPIIGTFNPRLIISIPWINVDWNPL